MAETSPRNGAAGPHGATRLAGLLTDPSRPPSATAVRTVPLAAPGMPGGRSAGAGAPVEAVGPGDVVAAASLPGVLPVPWDAITALRQQVAADIDALRKERRAAGAPLGSQDLEEAVRGRVRARVAEWAQQWALGHPPLTSDELERVRTEVFNLMFLAGALQRVLDRPGVEDVLIDGEWMYIDSHSRPRERVRSPFSTPGQAVEWVNQMAAASGHGERQLSYATARVEFDLPDGSRVAATLLTEDVVIAIRRHVLERAGLAELVQWGAVDSVLAAFLSSAVKAGLSMIIAGDMASGKTTLMRALGREVPARERLATLESEPELRLHFDDPGSHAHVLAFRTREGNGEREATGQVTLADLVPVSLRYKATRVMVGEVRGEEAVAMLEAMIAGGSGSMCTLHAKDPESVVDRLMVPLARAGLSDQAAYRLIAAAVDLIVYVDRIDETDQGGQEHRFVTHVWETAGRGEGGGVALSSVFAPREEAGEERAVPTKTPMSERRMLKLERKGFHRGWMTQYPHGQWQPMRRTGGAA
ncbi:CpaF/VirB11 family protein [Streptomyces sp. NPDC093509]|uniref:CpaF family protein n=1 Tax=Streptomyces sp. NPDC093509 TaxID=3154982 RepID=UPI00344B4662